MGLRLLCLAGFVLLVGAAQAAVGPGHPERTAFLAAALVIAVSAWLTRELRWLTYAAGALVALTLWLTVSWSADDESVLVRLVPWVAGALITWFALERMALAEGAAASGSRQVPSSPTKAETVVGGVLLVAVLAAAAIGATSSLEFPPSFQQQFNGGQGAQEVAEGLRPYLGMADELDTAARGDLGDALMLRVKAKAPDFWRGGAFDEYDGRVWRRSPALASGDVPPEAVDPGEGDESEPVETDILEQTVRVEAPAIGDVFGSPEVIITNLPPDRYEAHGDGGFALTPPLGRGAEYAATSLRSLVTADSLRTHDPRSGQLPPSVDQLYVRNGGATPRVAALAEEIAGTAPTTYDAIRALEAWLGANTTYTRDIPPLPDGADTVEQYVFVDRRGFCMQIASALTVMLRSLDVPARLAVGFTPGDESLLGGEFKVHADDAHAWVEVWFPGVGWQGFDPTADVPLSGEWDDSLLARLGRLLGRLAPALLVCGLVIAGAVLLVPRLRRRRPAEDWVARFYSHIEAEGAARGRPRRPAETPRAYVDALGESTLPHPDLDVVAQAVTTAAYSPDAPTDAEKERAEAVLTDALRSSPRPKRHRRLSRRD